ncbi:hypothetical protein B0F90DRAFT_1633579 [Multifurca ochricompacta]|uniref:J domain-containing protein n=1 Tax=Multifurca ochricompacta TaxID=376703 RepID=A0AAD4QM57_9AGAM|nr:hypothetical protein B0F90DRAFT_1633579 [Multifurca ochricompacta]
MLLKLNLNLSVTTAAIQHFLLRGHTRHASSSSSSSPFPFPTHRNPTPHQIFHLIPGASQAQIKARYYELARIFHPDSPTARNLPVSVRHTRFHAITKAYDILRGKSLHSRPYPDYDSATTSYAAELARQRHQYAQRQAYRRRAAAGAGGGFTEAEADGVGVSGDEAWKDQVLILVGLIVRFFFF